LEVPVDAPPPLSVRILQVKSLSMLDGLQQRAYIVFLLEGIVFAVIHVVAFVLLLG
jgi:hypothetical protein